MWEEYNQVQSQEVIRYSHLNMTPLMKQNGRHAKSQLVTMISAQWRSSIYTVGLG